jgi:hypothetical protein
MNRILKYLLISEGFWLLAAGLFGPIYAIFVANIQGGDILAAGSAYAAYSFAAAGMIFVISRWEDHVKHKEKLVMIGHMVGAAGIFGYLLVANTIQLFAVQIVLGLSQAIGDPAFDGIYSKNLDKGRFASEWGLYDSMDYLVTGVSAVVGGLIATVFGFQTLFLTMFGLSLISIAVSVRLYHLRYHTNVI